MWEYFKDWGYEAIPFYYPKVDRVWTVIIPVFKRCEFVQRALTSVLQQKTGDMQVMVVAVDTPSLHIPAAEPAEYWHYDNDLGPNRNWNRAVALARGKWIHILHDDDYVLPGFYKRLEALIQEYDQNDRLGVASTGYENVNTKGEVIFTKSLFGGFRGVLDSYNHLLPFNHLNPPAVVVKRQTYETAGGYRHNTLFGDWEFFLRASRYSKWAVDPALLARYYQKSESSITFGQQMQGVVQVLNCASRYIQPDLLLQAKARHLETFASLLN